MTDRSGPKTRVELILSARNIADRDVLSKSDPICVVFQRQTLSFSSGASRSGPYVQSTPAWVELGRTERIHNCLSPQWAKKIQLDYLFEAHQPLAFELYDIDSTSPVLSEHDFLGRMECELAEVVAAPEGALTRALEFKAKKRGELTVRAEEMDDGQKESLYLVCHGRQLDKKDFLGKSDPFFEFYRLHPESGERQVMVHRSEVIKKTLNPEWKPFEVLVRHLCEGDKDREFLIECWDHDENGGSSHDLIGSCRVSVNQLVGRRQMSIPLINEKKRHKKGEKYKDSGTLHFLQVDLRREYTFLDFITAGMQLEFAVAVDFTSSNGPIHSSASLHFFNQHYPNQYQMAIGAVLEICEHYNRTRLFEAMGFGAKVPPNFHQVSHLFPLNLVNSDRFAVGVEGVLNAYRVALTHTQLYGPTNFSPTINEFATKARRWPSDGARYQILLIITDGIITDMQKTISAIISASQLPLSIIIVGVGNEDFTKMDVLDSDNGLLAQGERTAARDIVQFVPFRNFLTGLTATADSPGRLAEVKAALAKEVLAEVPQQVASYMKSKGIVPMHIPPPPMLRQEPVGHPPVVPSSASAPSTTSKQPPSIYPPSPAMMMAAGGYERGYGEGEMNHEGDGFVGGEPPPSYQQAMSSGGGSASIRGEAAQIAELTGGIRRFGV